MRRRSNGLLTAAGGRVTDVMASLSKRRRLGSEKYKEIQRLQSLPAYSSGVSNLLGFETRYTHPHSLAGLYEQIFLDGGYRFQAARADPLILDCGANIGVSVAWFKKQYPRARIVAFEADPRVSAALASNVAVGSFADVSVVRKAVWISDGQMSFVAEGGDAGRLGDGNDTVETIRLRDWLTEPIDLLKIDIEGAETAVIEDCADSLHLVSMMALEFHSIVGREQHLGDTLRILESAGFRVWVRDEYAPRFPLVDSEAEAGMDMRLNIWAKRGNH
jgi:FkbM family methyltransferase